MTNILSSGFHSPCEEFDRDPLPFAETGAGFEERVGSWGTKAPSSRSLSYTITVPSAWVTRKSVVDEGTQRIDVHRELEMRPCGTQRKPSQRINERSNRMEG